jgi:hypothetical protein
MKMPPAGKEMLTKNGNPSSNRPHKTKTTGLILALCFFGTASCFAGDPTVGQLEAERVQIKA